MRPLHASIAALPLLWSAALADPLPAAATTPATTDPAGSLPRFSGELAAQAHREHPLRLAPGDFVQGRLSGRAMRLVLLDRDGKRARILAKGRRDDQDFMFIAGNRGPYTLDVRAPVAGSYAMQLTRQVPQGAQVAPATVPDSPRLRALQQALAAGSTTQAFWREVAAGGGPLVESAGVTPALERGELLVTFLWRGAVDNVRVMGAPSGDHDLLVRLAGSDVWYRSYRVPASTRLSYRLAPDVPDFDGTPVQRRRAILATAQRDPLNPRSFPARPLDPYDGDSVLELPAAPAQEWVEPRAGIAAGTVETVRLASKVLGNERTIVLYRSHGWQPGAAGNALVVLFYAENFTDEVPTPVILDNLVGSGMLPPTAAILIANPNGETRATELPPNAAFARFLSGELMPWARARGVHAEAASTVIAGASYGGLAAAHAGLRHPELFGNVYSQSGSFWWSPAHEEPEWLTREFATAPKKPVRFLDTTRHLRDVLRARGYDVSYREFAAGHDWFHWRGTLGNGLVRMLGKRQDSAGG
jgi:enterochelin esterase family protein